MAQITISLAPTLAISLALTGASGASVRIGPQTPVVTTALGEVLRGPKGEAGPQGPKGDTGDIAADPLAYYILAKA